MFETVDLLDPDCLKAFCEMLDDIDPDALTAEETAALRALYDDLLKVTKGQEHMTECVIPNCRATAVMHPGHLDDLLDSLPLIGKFLDAMRWESLDMIAYLHAQGTSQQEGMRMCAEIARTGDAEKLMAQGLDLERRHPLPIVVRD